MDSVKDRVHVPIKAGGGIFFNFHVPHATGENITDKPRAAVAYHFLHGSHMRERAFPLPEGTEYITPEVHGPGAVKGAAPDEYGREVDTFDQDVEEMCALTTEELDLSKMAARVVK